MKKAEANPKANRNILYVAYGAALLFGALILYFVFFMTVDRESVINNSYNSARLNSLSQWVVRGEIVSADVQVLARTDIDGEGNETRVYPYGDLFAHVVGYSGQGKTGLESLTNYYLLNSHVNLAQKVGAELSGSKTQGDRVITSLNTTLQQTAYDALGDRNGAVIAMEPDTGKILAMVSKPGFEPNTVAEDWDQLISQDNTSGQLLNRATQGLYPPGSAFKIVMALEYMREHPEDYLDYTFDCSGIYTNEGNVIQCYHRTAHGVQNLTQAFANSCNGAFANLGLLLDKDRLRELAESLLFNQPLPLSLEYSQSSYRLESTDPLWEVLQTSIGQGETQVTPMHTALITSAIANGGTLMQPYLADRVESADGKIVKKFVPQAYSSLMTAEESAALTSLMEAVVTEGTGSALRTDVYTAAGKTGSAEFDKTKESHAWFTGFAPIESPEIVVTVIVEEGGSGGQTAAPIARALMDAYFSG